MLDNTKIVLLSGKGDRFKKKGYSLPKGLLKIKGLELALHASKSIPDCETTIFAIQDYVNKKYNFEKILQKKFFTNFKIFNFKKYTNGQATSCYEVIKHNKEIKGGFFILSCDFSFSVPYREVEKLLGKNPDAIVFTYKATDFNYQNEKIYGWIRDNDENMVTHVSCKKRIEPHKIEDSIIIGTFYFVNKSTFIKYYKKLVLNKNFIYGETYIDIIIQLMVSDGLKVFNFKVDNFKDFGTPDQYEAQMHK